MEEAGRYLAYLACPLGMGLMMWMMMRGNSNGSELQVARAREPAAPSTRSNMLRIGALCFDWRVIAGLAAVGIAVVVVAPGLLGGALPLLLLAACPISMLVMMRSMRKRQMSGPLSHEIARLEEGRDAVSSRRRP